MKFPRILFTVALVAALGLGAGAPVFAAEPHQHAAGEPAKLTLDHGRKWPTDEPLRRNMAEIRKALAASHTGIHTGTMTPAGYSALGALVEARVASIVSECKLEPAADANLHLIVAQLIAGADVMKAKSKIAPATGAEQVVRAVNDYGRYFDHPGWKPLG